MTLSVWTSNDFHGHYPVGASAVVVAETEDEARAILAAELTEHGLTIGRATLVRLPLDKPKCRVLQDGEY